MRKASDDIDSKLIGFSSEHNEATLIRTHWPTDCSYTLTVPIANKQVCITAACIANTFDDYAKAWYHSYLATICFHVGRSLGARAPPSDT